MKTHHHLQIERYRYWLNRVKLARVPFNIKAGNLFLQCHWHVLLEWIYVRADQFLPHAFTLTSEEIYFPHTLQNTQNTLTGVTTAPETKTWVAQNTHTGVTMIADTKTQVTQYTHTGVTMIADTKTWVAQNTHAGVTMIADTKTQVTQNTHTGVIMMPDTKV